MGAERLKRDPEESVREEAAQWRERTLDDHAEVLESLCEHAEEALSFRAPEERARVLAFQFPRSPEREAEWLEFVTRARVKRSCEGH